jgi:hypothetical protein
MFSYNTIAESVDKLDVKGILTFVGFNITVATLFYSLVYSYAKNLLEKLNDFKDKCEKDNVPDKLKSKDCKNILHYFYSIDLITISALGLLAYSSLLGAILIMKFSHIWGNDIIRRVNLIIILLFLLFEVLYLVRFFVIRSKWRNSVYIFWIVLVIKIIEKAGLIYLNGYNYQEILPFICIVVLTIHLIACLIVSIIYTPITALLKIWKLKDALGE